MQKISSCSALCAALRAARSAHCKNKKQRRRAAKQKSREDLTAVSNAPTAVAEVAVPRHFDLDQDMGARNLDIIVCSRAGFRRPLVLALPDLPRSGMLMLLLSAKTGGLVAQALLPAVVK
eukprot:366289-Amphidinium_carterae.1